MVTWSITSMVVIPQVDEYAEFAWQVGWACSATDDTNTQSIN